MAIAFVRNSGAEAKEATAGGEFVLKITAGAVGNRWIVAVATANTSAEIPKEITDAASDVFKKDAEKSEVTEPIIQIWSAEIKSASTTELKVKGLHANAATSVTCTEWSGIQEEGTYVRATGAGAKAKSTVAESGVLSSAPKTTDVVFAAFSANSATTFTPEGSYKTLTGANKGSSSVGAQYLEASSATTAAKSKLSVEGTWAGTAAVYKSKVVAQTFTAKLEFKGALVKTFKLVKTLTAKLEFKGALVKTFKLVKTLTAKLEPKSKLVKSFIFVKVLTAGLSSIVADRMRGPVLDSFERPNENPIVQGWAKLAEYGQGEVVGNRFAEGLVYWTAEEFVEPTVVVEVTEPPTETGREVIIRTCIGGVKNGTNSEYSDYHGRMVREAAGTFSFSLGRKKVGEGSGSSLGKAEKIVVNAGDAIAVSVASGVIKFWHKPEGSPWVIAFEATDTNFTQGYVAVGTELAGRLRRFGIGPLNVPFPLQISVLKQLPASLEPKGALTKVFKIVKTLEASLSFSGFVGKQFSKAYTLVAASLSFAGTTTKSFFHTLTAMLEPKGTLGFSLVKTLAANLEFSGILDKTFRFMKILTASLTSTGELSRTAIKTLGAQLAFTGSITSSFRLVKKFKASFAPSGALQEETSKPNETPVTKDQPGIEGRNPRYRIPPIRIRVQR